MRNELIEVRKIGNIPPNQEFYLIEVQKIGNIPPNQGFFTLF